MQAKTIMNPWDRMVQQKQAACEHFIQDKIVMPNGVYCGKCGKAL